jgi:hypothetical protein
MMHHQQLPQTQTMERRAGTLEGATMKDNAESRRLMAEAIDIVNQAGSRFVLRDASLQECAVVHRALRTVVAAARAYLGAACNADPTEPKETPCVPSPPLADA